MRSRSVFTFSVPTPIFVPDPLAPGSGGKVRRHALLDLRQWNARSGATKDGLLPRMTSAGSAACGIQIAAGDGHAQIDLI